MAQTASIKGSIFVRAVEDLQKLLADGALTRESLQKKIGSEGIAFFDEKIQPMSWYPVKIYGDMLAVLRDEVGHGSEAYLHQRGAESAEALLAKGIYQQMDYLSRTQVMSAADAAERFKAFGRDLNLLVSLHDVIMNFGKEEALVDPDHPDRYIIEMTESAECPDTLVCTTTGFINRMASEHGTGDLWTWSRPRRDMVVFRMTRPI